MDSNKQIYHARYMGLNKQTYRAQNIDLKLIYVPEECRTAAIASTKAGLVDTFMKEHPDIKEFSILIEEKIPDLGVLHDFVVTQFKGAGGRFFFKGEPTTYEALMQSMLETAKHIIVTFTV